MEDTINQSTTQSVEKKRRAPSVKRAATKVQKEQSRGFPLPLYSDFVY